MQACINIEEVEEAEINIPFLCVLAAVSAELPVELVKTFTQVYRQQVYYVIVYSAFMEGQEEIAQSTYYAKNLIIIIGKFIHIISK